MTDENRYAKSNALLERALKAIPLGSQTFSKSHQQFPKGRAPMFLDRGQGGRVWDVDGNEYVDLVCGLLPVLLGYGDPDVDKAVKDQLDRGISFSLGTELEIELAEKLIQLIPCAESVRFGKNGTDATSAAVRLARAHTGRDRIVVLGYHGWQDWYIGATTRKKGIPEAVQQLTTKIAYNDMDALKSVFDQHPDEIAAVILEPMNAVDPAPGYLSEMKAFVNSKGALLVFDEIITGFRYANGGAQELFGVTPDLAAFGKAMGNGMPISAIVGRADVMALMEEVFFSGTFGGEALSLAASIAVVDKIQREPVVETLWKTGSKLEEGVNQRLADRGLAEVVKLVGKPCWKLIQFQDHANASKEAIKTLFLREMLSKGVLLNPSHNICFAHTDADVNHVLQAYEHSLNVIAEELEHPGLEDRLGIPVIRPVFAVRG